MKKILLLLQILIFGLTGNAQDTLWIKRIDGKPFAIHKVKTGEDLFILSRKYKVPPAVMADANNLSYQTGLKAGNTIWIPVDNYNFIRIESVIKSKAIYYKVNSGEELKDISRMVNVAQSTIQMWNHLSQPEIRYGQILQIGWIAFDASEVPFMPKANTNATTVTNTEKQSGTIGYKAPAATPFKVTRIDSIKNKPNLNDSSKNNVDNDTIVSPYQQLFEDQIMGQANNNESGAAVFYPLKMKMAEGVYYAFHNTATKGTIIKVTNPANGNYIYAKVIGAIPNLADYNNCIIALSTNAAKGLMAKEKRMFCKVEYR